jgi:hypothetical protein
MVGASTKAISTRYYANIHKNVIIQKQLSKLIINNHETISLLITQIVIVVYFTHFIAMTEGHEKSLATSSSLLLAFTHSLLWLKVVKNHLQPPLLFF